MITPLLRLPILFAALTMMVGCTYSGGDIGDPFHRKFHWASFVSGDDIVQSCTGSGIDRARLVYNALWDEHVRIYEWDTVRKSLRIRVIRPGNLLDIDPSDPMGAWRAGEAQVPLDAAALSSLDQALSAAGAYGEPALGLELPSHSYFWTAATCHGGRFVFTAWAAPSAVLDKAGLPAALAALDPGRATIPQAGPVPPDIMREYRLRQGKIQDFTFKVGGSGVVR